ncbi:MAG: citrate/2-methylcitrate synthase [Candidatus Binatia bacterium]|nr:citrate/2-methylcitrate synthase [Candidatus Binatia bacterium]
MSEIVSGLEGIFVAKTRTSRVDGEAGKLTIGGFPVERLAPAAAFEEVVFLLWEDRLPTQAEYRALRDDLSSRRQIPAEALLLLRRAADRNLHPMDALRIGASTLSLVEEDPLADTRAANVSRARTLLAAFPTLAAAYARLCAGAEPIQPDSSLGHTANYLYMLTGERPAENAVRALETYLNTVIDHGMNASTFSSRVIVSTRSDLTSAVVGAIGALKGPLHGGAPGPALDMVFEIQKRSKISGRTVEVEARQWAEETIAAGDRIMGFGHRVYKVRDPRAEVLNEAAAQLFADRSDASLYRDARIVEKELVATLALRKPDRRLETNVEFYTALVLHGIGLQADLFSPTFAVARVGGWTAHVLEQIDDDRLIRPRAMYVGDFDRAWTPLAER